MLVGCEARLSESMLVRGEKDMSGGLEDASDKRERTYVLLDRDCPAASRAFPDTGWRGDAAAALAAPVAGAVTNPVVEDGELGYDCPWFVVKLAVDGLPL